MITLLDLIEQTGYDITTKQDANWLLATRNEYAELIEQAEELVNE